MLLAQGAIIALLPIEKWIEDLNRMDTIGPILDPTLYKKYLDSGREQPTKALLTAALRFKLAVLDLQKLVQEGKIR